MASDVCVSLEDADQWTESFPAGVEDVLRVLGDPECLAILEATSEAAKTAAELVTQLEITCSTLYRKLDRLVDMSLLTVGYRPKADGHHPREFQLAIEEIYITLPDGAEVALLEGDTGPLQ